MAVVLFAANDGVHGSELWETDTVTGEVVLVKDIDPSNNIGSRISDLVVVKGIAYFSAFDGTSTLLWRSDGTANGTFVIDSASTGGVPFNITPVGGTVFFTGFAGGKIELFATNGTAANTHLVAEVAASNLMSLNGKLAFETSDQTNGSELWVSDGTAAGTQVLQDVLPVAGNGGPGNLSVVGNQLFFTTSHNNDSELWVTDGTSAGTTMVASHPNQTAFNLLIAFHNQLYYTGFSTAGTGLFTLDGTTGSERLIAGLSIQSNLQVAGDKLVFWGHGSDGQVMLYASDGTAAGTQAVEPFPQLGPLNPGGVAAGSQFFFIVPEDTGYFGLWVTDGTAVGTYLLKDFVPQGPTSPFTALKAVGSGILFTVDDGVHGPEVWVSDGTIAGTHLYADINPAIDLTPSTMVGATIGAGGLSYFEGSDPHQGGLYVTDGTQAGTHLLAPVSNTILAAVGNQLYFNNGIQIFGTDGSTAGTVAVSDLNIGLVTQGVGFNGRFYFVEGINGGPNPSHPGLYLSNGAAASETLIQAGNITSSLFTVGGRLVFSKQASSGAGASGIYISDGTAAGTVLAGAADSLGADHINNGLVAGSKLYFTSAATFGNSNLWVSDGTVAGTHTVVSAAGPISVETGFTAFGNEVVFTADDHAHGQEVWISDGTAAGTHILSDVNPTSDPSTSLSPGRVVQAGANDFFVAAAGGSAHGLYVIDATAAGAHLLLDPAIYSGPTMIGTFGSDLLFSATQGSVTRLYLSDGTTGGTFAFSSVFQTPREILAGESPLVVGGNIYYGFTDGLYRSDGTVGGEVRVSTHVPGAPEFANSQGFSGGPSFAGAPLYNVGGEIAYAADNGAGNLDFCLFDPTSGTTTVVTKLSFGDTLTNTIEVGNHLFFIGQPSSTSAAELWVSDGTAAGTHVVSPGLGVPSFALSNGVGFGSNLLFSTADPNSGTDLYISDGTGAGTRLLADVAQASFINNLIQIGSEVFFQVNQGVSTQQLWETDGTAAGTHAINTPVNPTALTAFGGRLFFQSNDGAGNVGLWSTDGTSTGAVELTSFGVSSVVALGSKLFFSGNSGPQQGLFVTDGAAAGVQFLGAPMASSASVVGNLLYFSATDAVNGSELWQSDGTVAGTHRVTDTETPHGSNPLGFAVTGGKIFFSANDGVHGQELFVSDGVAASLVKDIDPGSGSGLSGVTLTALNGKVYFDGFDGTNTTVWVSDGTAAGTTSLGIQPAGDMVAIGSELVFTSQFGPGLFATNGTAGNIQELTTEQASNFSVVNGKLFFTGFDQANGSELWITDGTVAGTHEITNATNPSGSNPTNFGVLSNGLTLVGTTGADVLTGGSGDDTLIGGGGGDSLTGGAGKDVFKYFATSDSAPNAFDIIQDFQTGQDKIDLQDVTPDQVSVVRSNGVSFVFVSTPNGPMTIAANGDVNGTDFLTGGTNHGGVYLIADNNGDVLIGSSAGDPIQGGNGNDVITGGGGGDAIFGGAGTNTFVYQVYSDSTAAAADGIFDFKTGIDKIDLTALNTTAVSLIRSGGSTFLFASGPNGELLQINSAFHDVNGDDILTGSTHGVYLIGDNAGDTLIGSVNGDPIQGGSGNDLIIGGGGGDALFGGAGVNTFKYLAASDSTATASDSIFDFKAGIDKIDLSAVRESSTDVFGILSQSGSSFLFVKLDPGQADEHDMTIILNGTPSITANDIIWGTAPTHAASAVSSHPIGETMAPPKGVDSGDGTSVHGLLDGGHDAPAAAFMPTPSHLVDPFEHYFLGPLNQHVAELVA